MQIIHMLNLNKTFIFSCIKTISCIWWPASSHYKRLLYKTLYWTQPGHNLVTHTSMVNTSMPLNCQYKTGPASTWPRTTRPSHRSNLPMISTQDWSVTYQNSYTDTDTSTHFTSQSRWILHQGLKFTFAWPRQLKHQISEFILDIHWHFIAWQAIGMTHMVWKLSSMTEFAYNFNIIYLLILN